MPELNLEPETELLTRDEYIAARTKQTVNALLYRPRSRGVHVAKLEARLNTYLSGMFGVVYDDAYQRAIKAKEVMPTE